VSIIHTNWLILFRKVIGVYCESYIKHTTTLCGENAMILNVNCGRWYITLPLDLKMLNELLNSLNQWGRKSFKTEHVYARQFNLQLNTGCTYKHDCCLCFFSRLQTRNSSMHYCCFYISLISYVERATNEKLKYAVDRRVLL
jgi:hypothetical protein